MINVLSNGDLFKDIKNNENDTQNKIEYFVVNMKELIGINDTFKVSQIIEIIDELSE